MTLSEELVQRANHVADAWFYGCDTSKAPMGFWHKIRDAALKELREVAAGNRL